jgi:multiple sugar transport system ATP-binding protein
MGRALARNPRVFLFDEPLSNLDAKLRVEMRTEIKKLHKRLGTTIVYVTHDQVEAMTLADRIAVMKDGQVQQFGTPYEIYNNPASRFVADFMGSPPMNFIECVVLDDKLVIESQGEKFELQVPHGDRLKNAGVDTVILGIRPEMITEPKPHVEGALVHSIPMQIEVTEPMGPDTIAFGQWNSTEIQARLSPEAGVDAQDTGKITVQVDTSKAVLFDAFSGARLGV